MPTPRRTLARASVPTTAAAATVALRNEYLGFFRDVLLNRVYNDEDHDGRLIDGHKWPIGANALSMAGQRRLDNYAALVATAVEDGIPGHVIETGVWRGGASFMAAKTLELLGSYAAARRTYLADSFCGIPDQRTYVAAGVQEVRAKVERTIAKDIGGAAHALSILNRNSPARAWSDAHALGLDTRRLRFLVGFFNATLPRLVDIDEPEVRFVVVRLDGDTFLSTYEAIQALYPRLSPGGFLVVDDYVDWGSCRRAVNLYRERHGVTEPITLVPHARKGESIRGVYWRKSPSPGHALCAQPGATNNAGGGGALALRPSGWLGNFTAPIEYTLGRSRFRSNSKVLQCAPPGARPNRAFIHTSSRTEEAWSL